MVSTVAALLMTPFAIWSTRTGVKNLCIYAPVLWAALAAYIVVVIPRAGPHGPIGLFVLGIAGSVLLGFVPPAK